MGEIPATEGIVIPFEMKDSYVFDETFRMSKQRFAEEARRLDNIYNDMNSIVTSMYEQRGTPPNTPVSPLEALSKYSLDKNMDGQVAVQLQFDVSPYAPDDVKIQTVNNTLMVTAVHEEKTDTHSSFRQYYREYKLPAGVDPNAIKAHVSRDGVLILEIPVPVNLGSSAQSVVIAEA